MLGARVSRGQAGLVGEDDGLDSVAQPEPAQDPRDVGLDGGLDKHESRGESVLLRPLASNWNSSSSRAVSSRARGVRPAARTRPTQTARLAGG